MRPQWKDQFQSSLQRLGGYCLSQLVRSWMRTLSYRGYFYDSSVDVGDDTFCGPVIYALWHEYIPIPFYLRSNSRLGMIVSKHRDAEWLGQAGVLEGFQLFRGSSGRGGAALLRSILEQRDFPGFVLTPDGPRGPRRKFASGAIFMASKLHIPIILIGLGYESPWRVKRTWDQFAVPWPGSRARMILGPRLYIPDNLDREAIEHHRLHCENQLNILTTLAETWATSGRPCIDSHPIFRSPIAV